MSAYPNFKGTYKLDSVNKLILADVLLQKWKLRYFEKIRDFAESERKLKLFETVSEGLTSCAMGAVTEGLYSLFAHSDNRLQALRRWGLNRFDSSAPLKQWVVRQAAGSLPLHAGH